MVESRIFAAVKELRHFNLRQIAQSGQCFRMTEIPMAAIPMAEAATKGLPAKETPAGEISVMNVLAKETLAEELAVMNVPAKEMLAEEISAMGMPAAKISGSDFMAYRVISGSRFLTVAQSGETVIFFCGEEELPYWENYFDLQTDYGKFVESVDKKDVYLQKAAAFGSGIRILRQDLWEMIITFIISQQKTIPAIQALVEALCLKYGSRMELSAEFVSGERDGAFYYAFPTPEQLSCATLEELQRLKLGYRAKYIYQVCRDVCSGELDLEKLKTYDYPTAFAYLQRFYGIGEKVANCVCLFGLHQIDAFPVDTWIHKVLLEQYACRCRGSTLAGVPQARLCDFLVKKYFSGYKGYAGVMQQYIFYYERYAVPR